MGFRPIITHPERLPGHGRDWSWLEDLVASDAHSPGRRPPLLSPARQRLCQLVSAQADHRLLREWPLAVLEGRELPGG